MDAYLIGVHLHTTDTEAVRRAVSALFAAEGFRPIGDDALSSVLEDEGSGPEAEEGYGVIVSGPCGAGWVSVYVADWPDSGALARGLSDRLQASVLELWVAGDTHWGYTYSERGQVADRFADDPKTVAETPAEAGLYRGQSEALRPILQVSPAEAEAVLAQARAAAGRFAAGAVDALAQALGLPFSHAFTSYDELLDADPEDCADDLEDWPQFRHLLFAPPPGREGLTG